MDSSRFNDIIHMYDEHLARFGHDDPRAMGWNYGADVRYQVMAEVVRERREPLTLLDVGCGVGLLADHLRTIELDRITYHGLDLNPDMLRIARERHPKAELHDVDLLGPEAGSLPIFDYVVMNGLFTYRGRHAEDEMIDYMFRMLRAAFDHTGRGMAFNVMSRQVDVEMDDLLHVPVDLVLDFVAAELSRHVVVRHDYGLYEYTTYVYREPSFGSLAHLRPRVERGGGRRSGGRSWFGRDVRTGDVDATGGR